MRGFKTLHVDVLAVLCCAAPEPQAVLSVALMDRHVAIGMGSGQLFIYSIEPLLDAIAEKSQPSMSATCHALGAEATGMSSAPSGVLSAHFCYLPRCSPERAACQRLFQVPARARLWLRNVSMLLVLLWCMCGWQLGL
jgi:hypothetical protein